MAAIRSSWGDACAKTADTETRKMARVRITRNEYTPAASGLRCGGMRMAVGLVLAGCCMAEPRLLLNSADVARIRKMAAAEPWAAKVVAGLVREADEWPARHVREFGLAEWAL